MGFCTKCGQARTGDIRFCTRCGTQFPAGPADAPDTVPHPAAATLVAGKTVPGDAAQQEEYPPTQTVSRPGAPATADQEYPETQAVSKPAFWDQGPEPDTAVTTPLPGQSFAPRGSASPPDGAGYEQAAAYPGQGQAAPQYPQEYPQAPQYPQYPPDGGYSRPGPYSQPGGYPPAYPQPGGPGGGTGAGKRAALIAVAVVFILAAGGGAYAVVSSVRGGSPGGQPTTALSSPPPTTASPTDTSTTLVPPPTTPPTTPSSTAPAGTVALTSQAAGNAASAQVVDLFNRYFDGINTHNYSEYAATLDAGMRGKNNQSTFNSGYATTNDSNETVTSITGSGARLTAVVTFTSHQDPADSVDNHSCNTWQLTLPLVAQGSGYLITSPPSGYAQYADC
jgi:hypothetical protein